MDSVPFETSILEKRKELELSKTKLNLFIWNKTGQWLDTDFSSEQGAIVLRNRLIRTRRLHKSMDKMCSSWDGLMKGILNGVMPFRVKCVGGVKEIIRIFKLYLANESVVIDLNIIEKFMDDYQHECVKANSSVFETDLMSYEERLKQLEQHSIGERRPFCMELLELRKEISKINVGIFEKWKQMKTNEKKAMGVQTAQKNVKLKVWEAIKPTLKILDKTKTSKEDREKWFEIGTFFQPVAPKKQKESFDTKNKTITVAKAVTIPMEQPVKDQDCGNNTTATSSKNNDGPPMIKRACRVPVPYHRSSFCLPQNQFPQNPAAVSPEPHGIAAYYPTPHSSNQSEPQPLATIPQESQRINVCHPTAQSSNQAGPQKSWNNYSNKITGYPQPVNIQGANYGPSAFGQMMPPHQSTSSQSFSNPEGSINDQSGNPPPQNQLNFGFYPNGLGPYTEPIPEACCEAPNNVNNQTEFFDSHHQSMDQMMPASSQLESSFAEEHCSSNSQEAIEQNKLQVNTSTEPENAEDVQNWFTPTITFSPSSGYVDLDEEIEEIANLANLDENHDHTSSEPENAVEEQHRFTPTIPLSPSPGYVDCDTEF
ncbi:hypothetical protein B9Z55_023083 [Caenorhabditis nigoni]|uniref:Uncharacterized protein n=2 Tax=Caenorhabditis nigoni TaxID=1611254 RepID=A0A2G5SNH4_9PELO|nr:hypothetical protein B9Z55_023083 [Caenorhabditis nigoni]